MKAVYSEQDVQEPNYTRLIEYALATSDAFMLVYVFTGWRRQLCAKARRIKLALRPYRLKRRYDSQWPATESMGDNYMIEVYRSRPEVMDILREPGSLYAWFPTVFPQDIAFFRQNRCWFFTCAHERFLWAYFQPPQDDAAISPLLGAVDIEKYKSIEELYYEDYQI